jgi:hypothetical protein
MLTDDELDAVLDEPCVLLGGRPPPPPAPTLTE